MDKYRDDSNLSPRGYRLQRASTLSLSSLNSRYSGFSTNTSSSSHFICNKEELTPSIPTSPDEIFRWMEFETLRGISVPSSSACPDSSYGNMTTFTVSILDFLLKNIRIGCGMKASLLKRRKRIANNPQ